MDDQKKVEIRKIMIAIDEATKEWKEDRIRSETFAIILQSLLEKIYRELEF